MELSVNGPVLDPLPREPIHSSSLSPLPSFGAAVIQNEDAMIAAIAKVKGLTVVTGTVSDFYSLGTQEVSVPIDLKEPRPCPAAI
jgi:hypothetical protein